MKDMIKAVLGVFFGLVIGIVFLNVFLFNPAVAPGCLENEYFLSGEWWQSQSCYKELPDGTYAPVHFKNLNGELKEFKT